MNQSDHIPEQGIGVKHVGICDDFFESGARSILLTQVISRMLKTRQGHGPGQEIDALPAPARAARPTIG